MTRPYPSPAAAARARPVAGPVALILAEDGVELDSTLAHLRAIGFGTAILALPEGLAPPEGAGDMRPALWRPAAPGAVARAVGETVAALPRGTWLHYAFNAEYLIFPFCETRRIGDLLAFHAEERRAAMPTWVVDLYAPDLATHPDGVDRDGAHLDARGYYALARTDPATGRPADRQLDLYGGLRWRFEEHVPPHRRRIDRIGLVRARPGLRLGDDNLWSEPELNTHACPWHANATAAVCSFRAAKALRANPASRRAIDSFLWPGAVPFRWQSRQLLDLGLIEPGQWF